MFFTLDNLGHQRCRVPGQYNLPPSSIHHSPSPSAHGSPTPSHSALPPINTDTRASGQPSTSSEPYHKAKDHSETNLQSGSSYRHTSSQIHSQDLGQLHTTLTTITLGTTSLPPITQVPSTSTP